MATKQNMYVGIKSEIEAVDLRINKAVIAWETNQNNKKEIAAYNIDRALEIRDEVAELKGEIKILIKGLDKDSSELERFENAFNRCDHFLKATKNTLNQNPMI